MRLFVPANEWYGWEDVELEFPESWDVREMRMAGHDSKALDGGEIEERLGQPVGTPPLRELARGKKRCAIIFDDMTRPTKTYQMLPAVLNELRAGGIEDDGIVFVMASGAHSGRMLSDFQMKLGADIPEKYLVFNHNPYENLVELGETNTGSPVYINREVMGCDLKVTIGASMPHFGYGFGGGSKMILPGIAGIDSITHNHRIREGTGPGSVDENVRRLDSEEAAKMVGVDFVVNAILNARCDVSDLVCGDVVKAHREVVKRGRKHYVTKVWHGADVAIGNGYPMANEGYKAYRIAEESVRDGGDLVFLLYTPEGCRVHYYNGRFGSDYGGRGWRPDVYIKEPWKMDRVLVVTPEILKADEYYYGKGSIWLDDWRLAMEHLMDRNGRDAKIAVYPTAAMQISERFARRASD
jgi:nickel-dependent lactate racemase